MPERIMPGKEVSRRGFLELSVAGIAAAAALFVSGCAAGEEEEGEEEEGEEEDD